MKYTWEETSVAGKLRIYRGKLIVGMLNRTWGGSDAYGEFLGTMLRFRKQDFLGHKISILDIEGASEIGDVVMDHWDKKMTIVYLNKTYLGELSDKTGQWHVADKDEDILFEPPLISETKGEFEQNYMNPAIVLTTFYIRSHYKVNRKIVQGIGIAILTALISISIHMFFS